MAYGPAYDNVTLGGRRVRRLGYGAMQLTGPNVTGPPRDHAAAIAVLRKAVENGVNHIDTSDYYGPHIVNRLIREALHPYPDDLVIVTKVGARRGEGGGWRATQSPAELEQAVLDNLTNLGLTTLDVVNLRVMGPEHGAVNRSVAPQFEALARLRERGLIRDLGVSGATADQIAEARGIAPVVCVQNLYNLAHRDDDALVDELAADSVAFVPFFPLGGFTPLQSLILSATAARVGTTAMQLALAWLLQRAPNILLIPGTSSVAHLQENLAAASVQLTSEAIAALDGVAREAAC